MRITWPNGPGDPPARLGIARLGIARLIQPGAYGQARCFVINQGSVFQAVTARLQNKLRRAPGGRRAGWPKQD